MDTLPVNEQSWRRVASIINNLPHALLLTGKPGVGLDVIAEHIARSTGTILDTILPKKRQTSGSYNVDTENGSIIIDDIRDLYTRTRSKFSSPQIVIIDFKNRPMSPQAQNAFLKLLEEPGQHIHFILATGNVSQLLPTVLSRCQRIDIAPITSSQTISLLDSLNIADPTRRSRIQFIADGLPQEIIALATDDAYYEARVKTVQDARIILSGDPFARLKTIHAYKDKRTTALQLIDDMIQQLRIGVSRAPSETLTHQLDTLVDAYDRIKANGNIQLNLAKVLL